MGWLAAPELTRTSTVAAAGRQTDRAIVIGGDAGGNQAGREPRLVGLFTRRRGMLDTVDELPPVESAACLVLLHDERQHRQGARFDLTTSPTLLGRVEGADIVLPYHTISRRQCRFLLRGGAWWVLDDMSTSGTYVAAQLYPWRRQPSAGAAPGQRCQ